MSSFKDSAGRDWNLRFDGILLADLRRALGINLADLTGADYLTLDRDQALLALVVAHLVKDQLAAHRVTREQFAADLVGQSLEDAQAALWEAAKVFFPPRRLSELQSSYATLRGQWEAMGPTLLLLGQPGVPAMMGDALARSMMTHVSTSENSKASSSAIGQAATPSNAATS